VLRGIDAEIRQGECVAVVGPSGCGKSSLLNVISGIDIPQRGRVVVADTDITRLNERGRTLFRRRNIGFVYQFFNLLPTLSVEENVLLPLALLGIGEGPRVEQALAVLEELGLGGRRASFPDRLSGGEQQRVALARALAHGPQMVLADEPTGNLDARSGTGVLALLDRLVRRRGHTLLMVTHSEQVADFADRVLHLEEGRLSPVHSP
jgi:putative ABC transport system ATP-binding protein